MKCIAVLAGTGLVALAVYLARCYWYPDAKCSCCKGRGRHEATNGKILRNCRWCDGSGRRRRVWQILTGTGR